MTWYIKKGDDIARDQKIRFSFYRDFDKGCPPTIVEESLVECADTYVLLPKLEKCSNSDRLFYREAPRHRCKGRKIGNNCTLITDLRSVDRRKFKEMIDYKGRP